MENKGMDTMINKIAADNGAEDIALQSVNKAIDDILDAVDIISKTVPTIQTNNMEEAEAKAKIIDTIDNAVAPYMADVIETFEIFEISEED